MAIRWVCTWGAGLIGTPYRGALTRTEPNSEDFSDGSDGGDNGGDGEDDANCDGGGDANGGDSLDARYGRSIF